MYNFPLRFQFKISTLANDFRATDANGELIAYVRQKMFKFKEDIQIYSDEQRVNLIYRIKANKWIDFNTMYSFYNELEEELGSVGRKGWASLWKATYEIFDPRRKQDFLIKEENAWAKVLDGLLGEIPILNFFTGYLFNPKYIVTRTDGQEVVRIAKEPSFFGRNFTITQLGDISEEEEVELLLGLMMMILLERRRG